MNRPIAIAAGGTGGHLFPAEALATELLARGHRIVLFTDARSTAFVSTAFAEAERFVLRGEGMAGRGIRRALRGGVQLLAGTWQARRILKRIDAAAVVGFGGYPAIPPALAAFSLGGRRPKVVLHEQNGVLGRANRLLAPRADALALSFAHTSRVPANARVHVVGNPVRQAIVELASQPYPAPDVGLRILVLGGSLGARVFSDLVPGAVAALPPELRARLMITQQVRPEDIDKVRAAYQMMGVPAELSSFFPDVARRLAGSHLVISRAGASSIAELACSGRPSLLVPLPGAIDDHQMANARVLADAGAARILPQAGLTPEGLAAEITAFLHFPARLEAAHQAAASLARPGAVKELADLVLNLIGTP
ncbi:undecaprenyldiphospho-muramoylpentapeptide beta-N-acetylglucosaminyltransferase [Rhodovarius lipocyclicus]|jgi:UDP-N-acetylglucosamine--N-acetylmuramyl-(pentapeptide) pyrophosphoryl-undecaprenol N-acetylglucosamine transferase|uniref:undecaprenyldiphospho-muramoylpentapeptide beta-N-acetylglucosaminyltransferase n=1 Tax=Rhodovarius lipocyclicus TaxID=268410 RepID=UPI00135A92EF|nr:undecaprenyldiphospho-muramoylpentapeptide beta-N-acetylglucosaminyltransferase [Rhodovarius lipocyclicus]